MTAEPSANEEASDGEVSDVSEEEEEEEDSSEEEEDDEGGDDDEDEEEEDDDEAAFYTMDHYDEENLPEYSCRYCGIHDPACVAHCVETKKWFCNAVVGNGGSHLVNHLVRSRSHQVKLHP